ncbi:hypothetical protein [Epilithonimonas hungarica]|uniref:Beta-carotene 15,15'-monooxygenase n=1 Tax=Epilithonimonas hungarica TaxID=454006 RepID=A0A1G7PW79_9FLAO|nr:hypothetical protein [Epilithonimonas hungarica]SDF90465.1 hypothetical protein SAMN05421825_2430 [Epilithonimonas hungarica]
MTTQKPEIGKILTEAYQYWMRTLPFQFLFSAIYFAIFMFAAMYAFRYYGLFEEVQKFQNLFYTDTQAFLKKYEVLMQTQNALSFAMVVLVIKAVIFPLNIGFFKIYRKLDLGETPEMSDLFVGFRGHYFFIFAIYSLFWSVVNTYLSVFTLVWIPMMLLIPALIFFKNSNFFEAFRINIQTFQKNIILIFVASFASILFSYSGILAFGFGLFLTFPFWNAMIYVLYKHLIADFQE